jgi:hypothetical protein
MIQTQPLEVSDFSLGITDYYLDGDQRSAKTMDNLFITPNNKPKTRWGCTYYQDQLPTGTARVPKLSQLDGVLLAFQGKKIYRPNSTTWAEVQGPGGGALLQAGDGNSVIVDSPWQSHLFFTSDGLGSAQKVYVSSGTYKAVNAGMPDIPAGVSTTPETAGPGTSYLYACYYFREYTVGSLTYEDHGPVYYMTAATTPLNPIGGSPNRVTVTLPAAIAAVENYDTTNMKIKIYRTTNGGTVYKYVGQVDYGVTSYTDSTADASLGAQLYTTGGVASNDTPPKAKYVHVVNGYGYWAHIKDGSETDPTLIRQSKSNDPDSVPTSFYVNAEKPVRGLSSIYDRPMVLCDQFIYRIDNFFGDDGSGGMILRKIDDKAGCVSAQSIVQTHVGLFWAGEQGFYWSDGYRVACVSEHLNISYKDIVGSDDRKKKISGTFDPANQRVTWGICGADDEGSGEPYRCWVLDLKKPFLPTQERKGGCFTSLSGSDTSFRPTQVMHMGNYMYRGDTRGFVLKHGSEYATDLKIVAAVAPSSWAELTIVHTYESPFLDFGTKFVRKWIPRVLISAGNTTNLSLAISSSNDNDRVTGDLKPIRYRGNITWGDDLPVWGDETAIWNKTGLVEEWRRFPAGGLRCNYKQITLTNASVRVVNSDLLGTATVNISTKTATLGGSYEWLTDMVDYYISFEDDDYDTEFLITARTSTTVTYSDATNVGPPSTGVYKWSVTGKPKGEVLELNGYVLHWGYVSKSHTPFSSSSLGSNPA